MSKCSEIDNHKACIPKDWGR